MNLACLTFANKFLRNRTCRNSQKMRTNTRPMALIWSKSFISVTCVSKGQQVEDSIDWTGLHFNQLEEDFRQGGYRGVAEPDAKLVRWFKAGWEVFLSLHPRVLNESGQTSRIGGSSFLGTIRSTLGLYINWAFFSSWSVYSSCPFQIHQ